MDVTGLVIVAVQLAILVLMVRYAVEPVTDHMTQEWAARRGVALRDAEVAAVRGRLQRSRRWRRAGAVVPFTVSFVGAVLAPTAYTVWTDRAFPLTWPGWFSALAASPLGLTAGYALGVLAAELARSRSRTPAVRETAAGTRLVRQYVPAWTRWALWVVPLVAGLVLLLIATVPLRREWTGERHLGEAGVSAASVAVLALIVELALRYVVTRPQPVASAHDAAVDDAIRSTSAHAVAGVGVAVLSWTLAGVIARLAETVEVPHVADSIRWIYVTNTLGIARFLLTVGGALAWYSLAGPRRWTVGRALEPAPARS